MKRVSLFVTCLMILVLSGVVSAYDFSKAGYREGAALPTSGAVIDMTTRNVIANDNVDDK